MFYVIWYLVGVVSSIIVLMIVNYSDEEARFGEIKFYDLLLSLIFGGLLGPAALIILAFIFIFYLVVYIKNIKFITFFMTRKIDLFALFRKR